MDTKTAPFRRDPTSGMAAETKEAKSAEAPRRCSCISPIFPRSKHSAVILLQIHQQQGRAAKGDYIFWHDTPARPICGFWRAQNNIKERMHAAQLFYFIFPVLRAHFSARLPLGIYFIARNHRGSSQSRCAYTPITQKLLFHANLGKKWP